MRPALSPRLVRTFRRSQPPWILLALLAAPLAPPLPRLQVAQAQEM